MVWARIPAGEELFLFPMSRPGQGPPVILFNGYQFSVMGVKQLGMKLTTYLNLVLRLRMSGAVPLLPLNTFTAWTGTN